MKYIYDKPTVDISHWLVSKDDLRRIYDFFVGRSLSKKVDFKLETQSGNNRTYESFSEFTDDLDVLLSEKEQIKNISISSSDYNSENNWSRHGWIQIGFQNNPTFFALRGECIDAHLKDWVEGTYVEMKKMAEIFQVEEGALKRMLIKKYGESWNKGRIIFDPNGTIRSQLEDEIKTTTKPVPQHASTIKNRWWENTPIQLLIILGAIAGIVGLYWALK